MGILAPKTINSSHVFKSNTLYKVDDNLSWNDIYPNAVLKHTTANVKLFIDGSRDATISAWRNSGIKYDRIVISNDNISFDTNPNAFNTYFDSHTSTVKSAIEFTTTKRLIVYNNKSISKYDGSERSDLLSTEKNRYSNYFKNSTKVVIDINSFSSWGIAGIQSITVSAPTYSPIGSLVTISATVKDSLGFNVEGAPIYLTLLSGLTNEILYSSATCSYTNTSGIAQIQLLLREETTVKFQVLVDDILASSVQTLYTGNYETSAYVRNVLYKSSKYSDSLDIFYNSIVALFANAGFQYEQLGITNSSIVDSANTTYEDMMFFIKDITYANNKYLTLAQAESLRSIIVQSLSASSDIQFQDIEIRSEQRSVVI